MSGYVPRKLRERAPKSAKPAPARKPAASAKTATATKRRPVTAKVPQQRRPSPRPSPTGRPSPGRSGRGRVRVSVLKRWARNLAATALALVVLAAGAFVAWLSVGSLNADGVDDRTAAVTRAAKAAASALFSYNYRDFDASIENGAAHATGAFAKEYTKTTEGMRDTAEKEKAQVTAVVADVAVIEDATDFKDKDGTGYDDAVEVLAFLDQTTKNANIEGERRDTARVVMTMVLTEKGWKAVGAKGV